MFCSKCGTQIDESAQFCQKCGTSVSAGVSESGAAAHTEHLEERRSSLNGTVRIAAGIVVVALLGGAYYYWQRNRLPECGSDEARSTLLSLVSESLYKDLSPKYAASARAFGSPDLDMISKGELSREGHSRACSARVVIALPQGVADLADRYARGDVGESQDEFDASALLANPEGYMEQRATETARNVERTIGAQQLRAAWKPEERRLVATIDYELVLTERQEGRFVVQMRPVSLLAMQIGLRLLAAEYPLQNQQVPHGSATPPVAPASESALQPQPMTSGDTPPSSDTWSRFAGKWEAGSHTASAITGGVEINGGTSPALTFEQGGSLPLTFVRDVGGAVLFEVRPPTQLTFQATPPETIRWVVLLVDEEGELGVALYEDVGRSPALPVSSTDIVDFCTADGDGCTGTFGYFRPGKY